MLNSTHKDDTVYTTSPDYLKLINFLVEPLLEVPDSLSVDCEEVKSTQRVWIRLAVDEVDKGKVYGRGGRNIQAIQTVLTTAASKVGKTLYLEIYEGVQSRNNSSYRQRYEPNRKFVRRRSRTQSQTMPKLSIRSRWQEE
ncbi:MAG: KH domain-containing protein [Crocosphaera sp.]|nr:KH domain-containing protein [Crocosphaera sp.]